ncbi:MAG: mechanosensitive ion channel domain-containing protein, partial [Pseudomonadota bacterium]
RMDPGLAHSIHKGVGYAGMALAALAGLSYAGLDITNLAIVAGALSVGIGFGLQSIVNNFVSGLILLVERPIKVGDWIIVNGAEGHVRRINVRATEIETFDRASMILPNSELITGTVQNWTHRNSLGRVLVVVGVSYSSDPDHVTRVLMKIAEDCEHVIRHPAPFVTFDNLGDSALEFTLRAYVGDVSKSLMTRTEIRRLIVLRFREEGIEIPFPQQDLHIKDISEVAQPFVISAAQQRRAS